MQASIAMLPHLLDALHEVREGLELRPLVVRRAHGDIDLDRLGDASHGVPLDCAVSAGMFMLVGRSTAPHYRGCRSPQQCVSWPVTDWGARACGTGQESERWAATG